jgi:large subunit ribosomal protein L1
MAENLVSIVHAIEKLKNKDSKFDESIDVAIHLGISESIKGTCDLPNSYSDDIKLIIFTANLNDQDIVKNNKFLIGDEELIASIKSKKSIVSDYKYSIASPDFMPKISKIAKILGPRGLMPDPKFGLVTNDISEIVNNILNGKIFFKSNKNKLIHMKIGKQSFAVDQLKDNFITLFDSVKQLKPSNVSNSNYIESIAITSTMGPGLFIDFKSL